MRTLRNLGAFTVAALLLSLPAGAEATPHKKSPAAQRKATRGGRGHHQRHGHAQGRHATRAGRKEPPKAHGKAKASRGSSDERERPVSTYTKGGGPNVQAEAAVVVDLKTGEELYAKHADDVRPIASISKLMAMMAVLERNLDLDGTTEILAADRDVARRGAPSRLPTGRKFTNRDLLHAALMASDNRAVPALGRAVGLDPERLTQAMNEKARSLGLTHTSFGDPTGLDDRNRSTPRELAKVLAAAIRVPLIAQITRKGSYLARAVDKPDYTVPYENTDAVARGGRFEVLTGKTGYTDLAGYCLVIAAHLPEDSGNRDVAMVFLGESGKMTRFGDFGRAAQWIAERRPGPRELRPSPGDPGEPDGKSGLAAEALPLLPATIGAAAAGEHPAGAAQ